MILPVYALGWTLNYEMFFYLVFGLCLFVPLPRMRFALLAAAFLLLVACGLLFQPSSAVARTYTDPILLEFLAGVMLAILSPLLVRCGTVAGLVLIGAAILSTLIFPFVGRALRSQGRPGGILPARDDGLLDELPNR